MSEAAEHLTLIEPTRGWPAPRWGELWEYRDLLRMLVARDFSSRYRQTLLGPLWFILQPLMTTAMFTVVFGKVAGIETEGVPGPFFYFCGLLGWTYFAQTITSGSQTFMVNAHLFSKVYFPRIIVPVAGVVSNLSVAALQLVPLALFYLYYGVMAPRPGSFSVTPGALLLAPLAILQLALLSLGVSLWMSAATAKYRDLAHFNQFLVQIWMFATPIFYPMSRLLEKIPGAWQWLLWLNPAAAPIEMLRVGLLGRGTLVASTAVGSATVTLLLLLTGWVVFSRAERTVTDSA